MYSRVANGIEVELNRVIINLRKGRKQLVGFTKPK